MGSKINFVDHDQHFYFMNQNEKCKYIIPTKGKYGLRKPALVVYVCLY